VVELRSVRYRWPRAARDTLAIEQMDIAAGASVFVQGPSGCGKSTLLGLLAGVLLPSAGQVRVLGQDWAALSSGARDAFRARHVGYVFQQFNLLPYLSVLANVALPLRLSRARAARAAPGEAQRLLEQMELPPVLWARPASELSVGQQQRVAAARALVGAPELVIADEPTSALDAARREAFMALLRARCAERGSTLVFVSHDERLADGFDTRVALAEVNAA
jgi:putative ABC transport system ATP-binding protein